MTSLTRSPITELRDHLGGFTARCKAARWFGALFHVRTAELITGDVEARVTLATAEAVVIEADFATASADLREALADGVVTPAEARLLTRDLSTGSRHATAHRATLNTLTA